MFWAESRPHFLTVVTTVVWVLRVRPPASVTEPKLTLRAITNGLKSRSAKMFSAHRCESGKSNHKVTRTPRSQRTILTALCSALSSASDGLFFGAGSLDGRFSEFVAVFIGCSALSGTSLFI